MSGEESDDYIMRVYNHMIENETNGVKKRGRKPGPKSKTMSAKGKQNQKADKEESRKPEPQSSRKSNHSVGKRSEVEELTDENRQLQALVDKYEREAKSVINKASKLRQHEKTAAEEVLELFRFNAYLIKHLPNSDQIVEQYLDQSHATNSQISRSAPTIKPNQPRKCLPFKSPVNTTPKKSTLDKSGPTTSGATKPRGSASKSNPTEDTPLRRRSPRKPGLYKEQLSTDDEDNGNDSAGQSSKDDTNKAQPSSPKAAAKDSSSKAKPASKKRAQKETDGQTKPKRKRRTRDTGPRGYFPCTFDPRQCDAIMDTKEHLDFHMSGHYEAKYVCPFCAYTGPTIPIIKRHLNKERELAGEEAKAGKRLTEDQRAHKDVKLYQCFGCKVCDKMHKKFENRCEHIEEDEDNQCEFSHDIDFEFKDHLKMHFVGAFKHVKNKEEKRQKISSIVDKFVDEQYFENRAKTDVLVEKFQSTAKSTEAKSKNKDKESEKEDKTNDEDQEKSEDKSEDEERAVELPEEPNESSDSDWD